MKNISRLAQATLVVSFVALSGCQTNSLSGTSTNGGGVALSGKIKGGQQPVSGATIQLYAVGITGDGSAATPLIGSTVTTDSNGNFDITGDWNCTSNTATYGNNPLLYIVATGGNPGGSGTNANLSLMAALGACATVTSSTSIIIDEVTTVGSIAALYPYMTSYSAVGSSTTDSQKLALAFTATSEYMNFSAGTAPGSALPSGYYASSTEINSLADSISACINSTGGTAGQSNTCGKLFTYATPSGGSAPTDTIGAVIDILGNTALMTSANVAAIWGLSPSSPPFQPTLASAPSYWTLPIIAVAPTLPSVLPASGTYTITNTSSGLAWDSGNAPASGAGISIQTAGTALGTNSQNWTLTPTGSGTYEITSAGSGYVANVASSTTTGAAVVQTTLAAGGGSSWEWSIVPVSSGTGYIINNLNSGFPVDANTNLAGAALEQKTSTNGGTTQVWNITSTSGGSCPATPITPEIWTSTNGWQSLSSISVPPGVEVSLSGAPTTLTGSAAYSWSSPISSTTLQQNNVPLSSGTNTFTLNYTNSCGTASTPLTYTVTVGGRTLSQSTCDILSTGGTPCGAAYSLTRRMLAAYSGNLFQLCYSTSNTSCTGTTQTIGTSATTGEVNAATANSFCAAVPNGSSCYISEIYDQSGNSNNLPSSLMALYQTSPYNGLPMVQTPAPTQSGTLTYDVSNTPETAYYRLRTGTTNIPTGNSAITEYYVRSNTGPVNTEGDFGDMESTVALSSSTKGNRFALAYSGANGTATTSTTAAYYCVDLQNYTANTSSASIALTCGASGTTLGTVTAPLNLPSPPLFTLIGKYTYGSTAAAGLVTIEMADATQGALSTLSSVAPSNVPALGGGISLSESGDGTFTMSSFQEGAIVPYTTTSTEDAAVQANIAAFYGQLPNPLTTSNYQGPCDVLAAASSTTCSAFTTATTAGWWGLRAYSNALAQTQSAATASSTNFAVEIERLSDNTTQYIALTATGDLNVAAAQTFCQNTVCNIVTWYDQTGGGHNMTEAAVSGQAQLLFNCANGVKVCASFMPFSTANSRFLGYATATNFSAAIPQPFTLNAVEDKTDEGASFGVLLSTVNSTSAYGIVLQSNRTEFAEDEDTASGSAGTTIDGQPLHSYVFHSHTAEFNNTAVSPVYIDGLYSNFNAVGTGTVPTFGPSAYIGVANEANHYDNWTGFIQETGVWASALTAAQVTALTANQRAYWQF